MEREFIRGGYCARKEEGGSEAVPDFRLLCAQGMAGAKSGGSIARERRAGLSGPAPRRSGFEEGNQSAGETRTLRSTVAAAICSQSRLVEKMHHYPKKFPPKFQLFPITSCCA